MIGPNNSTLPTNHRDQTRSFPVFNVNPFRDVPSFGCMCFSHSLGAVTTTQSSLSPAIEPLVVDEFGLTHVPHDYPYGTSIREGQGIIRVHQPAFIIPPHGSDNDFWNDGTLVESLTNFRSTAQHFWFNLGQPIPRQTPGSGTRDWPVLALIVRRPATSGSIGFENFYPGERVTFQHNHFFLRRWNSAPIGPGPEGNTDPSERASWRVLAAENAEFQARSYGVAQTTTFGLYWIEPWIPALVHVGNDLIDLE